MFGRASNMESQVNPGVINVKLHIVPFKFDKHQVEDVYIIILPSLFLWWPGAGDLSGTEPK